MHRRNPPRGGGEIEYPCLQRRHSLASVYYQQIFFTCYGWKLITKDTFRLNVFFRIVHTATAERCPVPTEHRSSVMYIHTYIHRHYNGQNIVQCRCFLQHCPMMLLHLSSPHVVSHSSEARTLLNSPKQRRASSFSPFSPFSLANLKPNSKIIYGMKQGFMWG